MEVPNQLSLPSIYEQTNERYFTYPEKRKKNRYADNVHDHYLNFVIKKKEKKKRIFQINYRVLPTNERTNERT